MLSYFENKKFTGLNNSDNNDYLNSLIFCLMHTKPLTKYFFEKGNTKTPFIQSYLSIVVCLWLKEVFSVKPTTLHKLIIEKYPQYEKIDSRDPKDLFIDLIKIFRDELPFVYSHIPETSSDLYKKSMINFKNNIITKIFYGQKIVTYTCSSCYTEDSRIEEFNVVDSISKDVRGSLKNYFDTDFIQEMCHECCIEYTTKEHKVTKKIYTLPDTFILKTPPGFLLEKEINISKYCYTNTSESVCYELDRVICRDNSNKYYTVVKNKDNIWYSFRDEEYSIIKFNNIVSPYLVFYQRK